MGWHSVTQSVIFLSNCSHPLLLFLPLVLSIKTVFKVAAGGLVLTSAYQLLRRGCTYDQLITAVNTCVLPAGAKLLQIIEGSVYLKVQAERLAALEHLWRLYKNGTLKKRLQALFVTDEMRDLAGGEQVEVIVTIDEEEYDKTRNELATVETQGTFKKLSWSIQVTNYLESGLNQQFVGCCPRHFSLIVEVKGGQVIPVLLVSNPNCRDTSPT